MEYRVLGKTGLRVSTLSFGASSLGGVFHDVDEADCLRTVKVGIDNGINLIDVSPFYGLTKSETVLGKALKGIPRDKYYLATKVGRYGDAEFDFSAARVTRSVDESLKRMGLDHIDIIQCHDIEYGSITQVVDETIPALRKLRDAGKVRFIGVTGLPLKIFREVLARTEVDSILSYNHFALNDTTLKGLVPLLESRRLGIINASPLSQGLLTHAGAPKWHPASDEFKNAFKKVVAFCDAHGINIEKLAVQFSVSDPSIHSTIVSTAASKHLLENIEWVEEPIDKEKLKTVWDQLAPVRDTTWQSGRAENN